MMQSRFKNLTLSNMLVKRFNDPPRQDRQFSNLEASKLGSSRRTLSKPQPSHRGIMISTIMLFTITLENL